MANMELINQLGSNGVLKGLTKKAGGDRISAEAFQGTLLTIVGNDSKLQECTAQSILSAASQALMLNLSLSKSLGYAYVIPYKNHKGKTEAQFQIGWKGLVQLAQRSGLYKTIRSSVVYEGQIEDIDFITGKITRGQKRSDEVIGYIAYFELINGFSANMYMSKQDMENHARIYSQSYGYDVKNHKQNSMWSKNFDIMGTKTVLKLLLGKYGPLSVAMERAMQADQAAVNADGTFRYIDNDKSSTIDIETGEIINPVNDDDDVITVNNTYSTASAVPVDDITNEAP